MVISASQVCNLCCFAEQNLNTCTELLPTIPQLQTYDEIPNYPVSFVVSQFLKRWADSLQRTVEEAQRACIELRAT